MIGEEFSRDFFERHLLSPTRIFQMQVDGLADYDTGVLLKKELIGLRPVLNVELRDYRADGSSLFEVEFSGQRGDFAQILNASVIAPLNAKMGRNVFRLVSASGQAVRLTCARGKDPAELTAAFNGLPPASLAEAPPERLRELIQSDAARAKVQAINPVGIQRMNAPASAPAAPKKGAVGAAGSF
jgi:serine/threonine-protein kinase